LHNYSHNKMLKSIIGYFIGERKQDIAVKFNVWHLHADDNDEEIFTKKYSDLTRATADEMASHFIKELVTTELYDKKYPAVDYERPFDNKDVGKNKNREYDLVYVIDADIKHPDMLSHDLLQEKIFHLYDVWHVEDYLDEGADDVWYKCIEKCVSYNNAKKAVKNFTKAYKRGTTYYDKLVIAPSLQDVRTDYYDYEEFNLNRT
jgi:hypothetical protein